MALYRLTPASGSVPAFVTRESDGAIIPEDPLNLDYLAYLAWVAAGNTPDSGATSNPTTIGTTTFWNRFTSSEQSAIQSQYNAALGAGLPLAWQMMSWLAAGQISLTASATSSWMSSLVSAGCITSSRSTTILTP